MTEIPETLEELCNHIVDNCDRIPVREKIEGKWGSHFLTELPVKTALKHMAKFIVEGRIPVLIIKLDDDGFPKESDNLLEKKK